MPLLILQVEELLESGHISANERNSVEILCRAVNDWPTPIISFEDYELQVREFLGGPVTQETIDVRLRKVDYSAHAWQSESDC